MPNTVKEVSMPTVAQESLRSMLVQLRQQEAQVNAYVRGLRDSLGLEGDDWTLNLESMTFVKQPREEQVNGVGAASGNSKGE
jgi:outer membrane receptor for monomeric catechols